MRTHRFGHARSRSDPNQDHPAPVDNRLKVGFIQALRPLRGHDRHWPSARTGREITIVPLPR
jgi:hypothetical protein